MVAWKAYGGDAASAGRLKITEAAVARVEHPVGAHALGFDDDVEQPAGALRRAMVRTRVDPVDVSRDGGIFQQTQYRRRRQVHVADDDDAGTPTPDLTQQLRQRKIGPQVAGLLFDLGFHERCRGPRKGRVETQSQTLQAKDRIVSRFAILARGGPVLGSCGRETGRCDGLWIDPDASWLQRSGDPETEAPDAVLLAFDASQEKRVEAVERQDVGSMPSDGPTEAHGVHAALPEMRRKPW